jgi:Ca-activated chloride channel family protein
MGRRAGLGHSGGTSFEGAAMHRTTLFAVTALTLTAAAGLSRWSQARSTVAPPPPVASAGEGLRLELRASHALLSASGGDVFTEVTVRATPPADHEARPVSMALVIDTSGSMQGPKLDDAKRAAHRFVAQLGPQDELVLVHFASDASATPLMPMAGDGRSDADRFIDSLMASGGTNISSALRTAANALAGAHGVRRIVLLSDGQPTEGEQSKDGLGAIATGVHQDGVAVTALGVGADFDSQVMLTIVDRGGGFYGYLKDASKLDEVLEKELAQARAAFARSVVLRLVPGAEFSVDELPGRTVVWQGRTAVVPLPDLGRAGEAKVYLRLRGTGTGQDVIPLVNASLSWVGDAEGARPAGAEASLSLPVSDDADAVESSKQPAVFAAAVRAVGTTQLVLAAAAYQRGDDATAFSLLDNARGIFGMSADALAGESESLRHTQEEWQKPHDAETRRHLGLALEKKKLSNFGRENDGY